jgi:hypothetical protein
MPIPILATRLYIPPLRTGIVPRRVDYAFFKVEALKKDALTHEAPAIVGCLTSSVLAYSAAAGLKHKQS